MAATAISDDARERPEIAYQPLVSVLAAVILGIVVDRHWPVSLEVGVSVAVVSLGLWWIAWRRQRDAAAYAALVLAFVASGAAWHHAGWNLFNAHELGLFARDESQPACVEAIALTAPRRAPAPPYDPMRAMQIGDRSRLEVDVAAIRDRGRWRSAAGNVTLLVDGHLLGVRAGDRIRIFGQLAKVHAPENPGEFDYAAHARADRRLCVLRSETPDCVTVVEDGARWSPMRLVDGLRLVGDELLWRNLDQRRSGLAAAMFLGLRDELETDTSQAFLETGTIHLLVISGANVAILAGCLLLLFRAGLLSRTVALAAVAVLSVLYAVVTDLQPPVVRATVVILVFCAAQLLGRRAWQLNSLAAAGLVVLMLNPAELFRAGTQLSFLSFAALISAPRLKLPRNPLDRLIAETRPLPERLMRRAAREITNAVLVSLVIWLVVLPLVMSRFHLVSPIALALGPVLAIPVTLAMAAGFGVLLLGWFSTTLGTLMGWACDKNLWVVEGLVSVGQRSPGNHAWVSGPAEWWLAGFYAALVVWLVAPRWRPPRRWCVGLLAGWVGLGLISSAIAARHTDRLDCTFLSVGHGLAVVVQTPGGQTILYDAGRLGSPTAGARSIAGFLWSRGVTRLDAVVISHADSDHYNALPGTVRLDPHKKILASLWYSPS